MKKLKKITCINKFSANLTSEFCQCNTRTLQSLFFYALHTQYNHIATIVTKNRTCSITNNFHVTYWNLLHLEENNLYATITYIKIFQLATVLHRNIICAKLYVEFNLYVYTAWQAIVIIYSGISIIMLCNMLLLQTTQEPHNNAIHRSNLIITKTTL